jgi:hypothetical protein
MNIENEIIEIRNQLRLAMNGVVSTSMREKGINYRLNFGVSLLELKHIASTHQQDAKLAEALWKEDIREFKILASYVQPVESFDKEDALRWVKDIPYMEIAEACARNLFHKMKAAKELALELLSEERKGYNHCSAFLILFYWLNDKENVLSIDESSLILSSAVAVMKESPNAPFSDRQSAINALRSYGLQSLKQANEVLAAVASLKESSVPEQAEAFEQLKFEFEYSY